MGRAVTMGENYYFCCASWLYLSLKWALFENSSSGKRETYRFQAHCTVAILVSSYTGSIYPESPFILVSASPS